MEPHTQGMDTANTAQGTSLWLFCPAVIIKTIQEGFVRSINRSQKSCTGSNLSNFMVYKTEVTQMIISQGETQEPTRGLVILKYLQRQTQWVLLSLRSGKKSSFSCSYGNWISTLSYIFCFPSCLPFLLILFHLPLPYVTAGYNVKNCIKNKQSKLSNLYCIWHVGILYKGIFIEKPLPLDFYLFTSELGDFSGINIHAFYLDLMKTSKLKVHTCEVKRRSK